VNAPRLRSLATAVPEHVVFLEDAKALVGALFANGGPLEAKAEDGGAAPNTHDAASWERLLPVFDHGAIETRRVCMPVSWYAAPHDFREKNDRYVEHAVRLASRASLLALDRAGLGPRDVDHVVFVSSTGLATPSLDALLANELGFRENVRRTPIWGLGCAGGAAGLAHARDFALASPGATILLVALELCSLAFQQRDRSKRNLVAASLFGDGVAAAVVAGTEAGAGDVGAGAAPADLEIVASRSVLWKDTLDVMGWEIDGDGLHVVFSRDIPTIVRQRVRASLDRFLEEEGLAIEAIDHVASHPGGLKVLEAYQETLGVSPETFRHARAVLREFGNMSSPTCLFVLERLVASGEIASGERALVTALGPGFSAEYVLLRAV
jgi:alkylresorcinol/alkylpyrone synthase